MSEIKGKFLYSKDEIIKAKEDFGFSKARMSGFYNDLKTLKPEIEKIYDNHVFNLGYGLDDAPYHGWDGENLKGMREIDREICKRFQEIYAIILCGISD